MIITQVKVVPYQGSNDNLVAIVNLVIDKTFRLGGIQVYRKTKGGFGVSYPCHYRQSKEDHVYNPITPEVSKYFENTIIKAVEDYDV